MKTNGLLTALFGKAALVVMLVLGMTGCATEPAPVELVPFKEGHQATLETSPYIPLNATVITSFDGKAVRWGDLGDSGKHDISAGTHTLTSETTSVRFNFLAGHTYRVDLKWVGGLFSGQTALIVTDRTDPDTIRYNVTPYTEAVAVAPTPTVSQLVVLSGPVTPPDSDFEVTQNKDGKTLTISRYKGTVKNIIIPATLYGLPVTIIGGEAFVNKGLIGVVIPDSIISIEGGAFSESLIHGNPNQLTSVTIGNNVTTIGAAAFYGNKLTSLTIPDSVITIGNSAFSSNQLTSVTIGKSVKTIGGGAFSGGSSNYLLGTIYTGNQLTNVTIPDSVTTIGGSAFEYNQLASVTLGSGLIDVGDDAFRGNKLTSIIIPNRVTTIGSSAFRNNQLTSVTISNSVTDIGAQSFQNNQLNSITLGSGLIDIRGSAFSDNPLTSITIARDVRDERVSIYNGGVITYYNRGGIRPGAGFEENFINFYTSQNRTPGTYVKNGPIWSKK